MNAADARRLGMLLERIHAQASNGLAFSTNEYDVRRYADIVRTLGEMGSLLEAGDLLENGSAIGLGRPASAIGSQEYATPKIAVAAVVFSPEHEVLLVQREQRLWTLPGGYADVGFDPARNAENEVKEETGLDVRVTAVVGIYDSSLHKFPTFGRHVYTIVFHAELLGGSLCADPVETLGASFYNVDSLPPVPHVISSQIDLAYRIHHGVSVKAFVDREG